MIVLILSFALGFATVFTPCILPLLPVYAIQLYTRKIALRLAGVGAGTFLALLIFGTLLSVASSLFAIRRYVLLAISLSIIAFAFLLLYPEKLAFLSRLEAPVASVPSGLVGGFFLAVIWIPCALPLFLAAAGSALTDPILFPLASLLYALGVTLGLFVVALLIRVSGKRLPYEKARFIISALLGAYGVYLLVSCLR